MAGNQSESIKVSVFGAGYVGMSLGVLLAQKYDVTIVDIDIDKLEAISKKKSTVYDELIDDFLQSKELKLSTSLSSPELIESTDIFIIATPTDYDPKTNSFDTSSVEEVINEIFKYTGIKIFDEHFDKKKGYAIYKSKIKNIMVCVITLNDLNNIKALPTGPEHKINFLQI